MCKFDFEKILIKAKEGDAIAQNSLAASYATGDGVKKDLDKAVYWYRQASLNNDPDAFYNLALMHLFGEGMNKNEKLAISMFEEAIECGSSDACLVLAEAYESGMFSLNTDINKAIELYLHATLFGSIKGIKGIGKLLIADRIDVNQLSEVMDNFKMRG